MNREDFIRKTLIMSDDELIDEFSRLAVAKSNEPAFTEKWKEYREQGKILRDEITYRMGGTK